MLLSTIASMLVISHRLEDVAISRAMQHVIKMCIVYTSREEEWQFPSQIMPVVRDTVAHAGFKITKVDTSYP